MSHLSSEVSNLKAMVLSVCDRVSQVAGHRDTDLSQSDYVDPTSALPAGPQLNVPRSHSDPSSQSRPHPVSNAHKSDTDRRFNIIVFGVVERPSGSSRFTRNMKDFQEVSSIISQLEKDSDHSSSVRDCRRLGKYVNNLSRPRPLHVSFISFVFTVDIEPATPDTSTIPASSLCSIDISLEDTFLALSSCDPSKAKGGDSTPTLILNQAAAALAEPVHHLFSLCLSKSYLPAEWRCHHVTPIHKSGDRSLVTNYRPIALLCCLSKVLERLVFDKVYDFIVKSFISNSQFGFVRNRSTLHQLLLYSEFLHTAFENRQQVDSIYLDICKAFDTVSHTCPNYGMLA